MARVILGAAAAMGGLPPLPRRHAPDPHAGQTPEQRDRAIAAAEAKRARRRARAIRRDGTRDGTRVEPAAASDEARP
jgi:hypothetical protein